ncbi:MAG: hypothetical protein IJG45_06460 [Oscillospiraceae bacterium]|nr:hypothetical protein [Oscillospiraceae bacterium]
MQYQALRKEASSRLMLFATLSIILILLAMAAVVWAVMDESFAVYPVPGEMRFLLRIIVFIILIPFLGVASLPIIALFMIYANARSDRPLKTAGFTLLRGYMIANIVFCAFELLISLIPLVTFYTVPMATSIFSSLLSLYIAIASVSALKTAKEVVTFGFTYRKISTLLPVSILCSAGLLGLNLLLTVLANTVPSLMAELSSFRMSTAALYYSRVAVSGLSIISSVLFAILCIRGKKALSHHSAAPTDPLEF